MKHKKTIIAFALILGLALFVQQIVYAYENYDFKLEGTYSNNKQSFDWISFNNDGPNTFRLYYMADGSQKEDKGIYEKVSDRKYILSSAYLGNVEVTCYKKFPNTVGFTMESGKAKCDFIQNSPIPGQIEYSKIYTFEDIKSAIETIEKEFTRDWEGCTLTKIYYAGDEISKDYQDSADRNDADEVLVLLSSFDVGGSSEISALNPNSTYDNWMWILVRTNGGEWQHVDHGYCLELFQ